MTDLERLLAALNGAADPRPTPTDPEVGAPARRPGRRRPALTRTQVESIRRRRRLPLSRRPRKTELAVEFQVDRWTIRKALQARPPYDWGEPVPRKGARHRDRGTGRVGPLN